MFSTAVIALLGVLLSIATVIPGIRLGSLPLLTLVPVEHRSHRGKSLGL
jgi:hypothetical protein